MALNGIGGGNAGALERFQAIRDLAKKKLEGADGQTNLAELIKRKQMELGTGGGAAARIPAERILPGPAAPPAVPGNAASAALLGPSGYGRSGGMQKQTPKPTLGQNIDFMA